MKNILLIGCLGRLGIEISSYVAELSDFRIVAGVDKKSKNLKNKDSKDFKINNKFDSCIFNYDVYSDIKEVLEDKILADVVIDFSHSSALSSTLEYCTQNSVPLILGTTGLSDVDRENIFKASEQIPIFWSVNMSIGIDILTDVCGLIVEKSNNIFDIDIIEKHHSKKIDSPSGTAKMIAESIKSKFESLNFSKFVSSECLVQDSSHETNNNCNSCNNCCRKNDEIRIHSIRAGDIPGEHSVMFSYGDEVLAVSHVANSKKVFAKGAVNIINFITKQLPVHYNNID